MVYHSKLTQLLAYICAVLLIPVYVSGPFIVLYLAVFKHSVAQWYVIVLLLLFLSYVSYIGVRNLCLLVHFIRYIKRRIEFDENGIKLIENSDSEYFLWEQLIGSKEYSDCQIFCLIDSQGNHLFSTWEYAQNYKKFREFAYSKIGI